MCNFAFLRHIFYDFYLQNGKKFLVTKGGPIKKFFVQGGVNKVSCRRGDSDFTLQEGGNGTLPPPMPTYGRKPPSSSPSQKGTFG